MTSVIAIFDFSGSRIPSVTDYHKKGLLELPALPDNLKISKADEMNCGTFNFCSIMIEKISKETKERFKQMILDGKCYAIVRGHSKSGRFYYSVLGLDGQNHWDFTPALSEMSGTRKYNKSPMPFWEIHDDIFHLIAQYVFKGEYTYWKVRDMIVVI